MGRRIRLTVRLDGFAELRRFTGGVDPDPVDAAVLADLAGVDGISLRYHPDEESVSERDLDMVSMVAKSVLTFEVSRQPKAVEEALSRRPDRIVFISESAYEMTGEREFGLDVVSQPQRTEAVIARCRKERVSPWVLIDPREEQVTAARDVGADGVVISTARFALPPVSEDEERDYPEELAAIDTAAQAAVDHGLRTSIMGGLSRRNLQEVLAIRDIEEIILGHALVARATFIGFENALQEIIDDLPRVGEEV